VSDLEDVEADRRRAALKRVLEQSGRSPAAVAREAGLANANTIYNFLKGRSNSLSVPTCEKLAAVLGISLSALTEIPSRQGFAETQRNFSSPAAPDVAALQSEIRRLRGIAEQAWQEANRSAMDSSNSFVERHGLPLRRHRMF